MAWSKRNRTRGKGVPLRHATLRRRTSQRVKRFISHWVGGPSHPPPTPEELKERDEHGIPVVYRNDPPEPIDQEALEAFRVFEDWCEEHRLKAFPASPRTVLIFVRESPVEVEGVALFDIWMAIRHVHGAHYWHTDADPVMLLITGGVLVERDGSVSIPESVERSWETWET